MPEPASESTPPTAVRRCAAAMIDRHGAAALGLAALSASRSLSTAAPGDAAFWLCVCDLIRARNRAVKVKAAALRRGVH